MRIQKRDLPQKTCPACGRPFTWRKRWRNQWHSVIYCSERCRRQRRKAASEGTPNGS
ncbi:DUF2256 domain-containing protein [Biformimicrobium ophioploci]|uniref:DUF2256 domain-containing protein n=1 Tax=Biformimicrobium ophioploci TaxID=3036711 RepID=UPI00255392F7|nr:DUF2256 domain-containing protein [Microbulbifer sp. NKW57]